MKKLKVLALVLGIGLSLSAIPVQAQGIWGTCTSSGSDSAICADQSEATDIVKLLINTLLFAIGALSVVMIVHAGLKYTTSRGDAEQIKSAKNTLLYAVIGLVVAILAFTIVNFVIGIFGQSEDNSSTAQTSVDGGNNI